MIKRALCRVGGGGAEVWADTELIEGVMKVES